MFSLLNLSKHGTSIFFSFRAVKKMAEDQSAGIGAQIGSAIKNKLTDSIRNMDVLTIIQNIVATAPEDEESGEIREKLQGVLRQYNEMSENEKVQFANKLKEALATKLQMKLQDTPLNLTGLDEAISQAIMFKLLLVGAGALLFLIVIVFFGYKLYKSIKDKEKKREEKKKAKQMKKKK